MDKPIVLDSAAVGRLLGVTAATVTQYRSDSRNGRRYSSHPFPEPDGHSGRSPFWLPSRSQEIEEWARTRPGQGTGSGRFQSVA
jgi:hypothetical protein